MTTYETGATSHAVNDLILFTDNTKELAELRDSIYSWMVQADILTPGVYEWDAYATFKKLLEKARESYCREFKYTGVGHIFFMTPEEGCEFCQLYLDDYENWKQENI